MPYAPHFRVILSGILGDPLAPSEIFSFSIALDNPTSIVQGPLVDPNLLASCVNYFARAGTRIGANAVLTKVRVETLVQGALPGKTQQTGAADAMVNVPGNKPVGSTLSDPFQICFVVSLNAATATRRAKGRYYLPAPTDMSLNAVTGRWGTFGVTEIVTSSKQFVQDLNATANVGVVVVASSVDGNHPVTSIRGGDVPDTQRRRRNALVESYVTATIV